MANQILLGTATYKVVNNWRLAKRLELIDQWLTTNKAVNFKHIKREGNKVSDLLENLGVDRDWNLYTGSLNITTNASQLQEYNELVQSEEAHPDASD